MATFKVYKDRAGEWRWYLQARNGNKVADSGEGYASKQGALDGVKFVKTNAPGAAVEE